MERGQIMGDIISFVRRKGRTMKDSVLPVVSDIRKRKYTFEQSARQLIKCARITTLPINVLKVAEALGFAIYKTDLKDGIRGAMVDSDRAFVDDKKRVIVVPNEDSLKKIFFTVAHEIGHFCLHCNDQENFYMRETIHKDEQTEAMENEADLFAATLLMPEELFRNYVESVRYKYNSRKSLMNDICETFCVEQDAVERRFTELNISI